jgi:hypothetical protein
MSDAIGFRVGVDYHEATLFVSSKRLQLGFASLELSDVIPEATVPRGP